MIFVLIRFVDGESMTRHVDPDPEGEKQCLDLLVAMVKPWLG